MTQHKHLTGLSDEQVLKSREKHGNNLLSPPKKDPIWKLFFEKFQDPIIRILLIAVVLSLGISILMQIKTGVSEYAEPIGIFCAILLASGVSFWFELDSNRKFDILNAVNDNVLIKVIRNGNICEVPKRDIVVGDIVLLETGEEVPADGELLETVSLQIDESCLTGEPIISKTTNKESFKNEATYPSNWVMRGTKVMNGHGVMSVKRVGDATEYGKVAQTAMESSIEKTPLNQQLDVLAKFIGIVGLFLSALTFSILFFKDIFFGNTTYSLRQLGLLGVAMTALFVTLIKFWFPIVYNIFELRGKKKKLPKIVKRGTWLRWIFFGFLVFIAGCGISFLFGINPLDADSWISMKTAGRILQYFMIAITLVVVAVPEGLPMSVTLSLALSIKNMLKTNNLVRRIHACETMGAITVICTDKTGTLTQNQMQVFETHFYGLKNIGFTNDDIGNLILESISTNSTAFLDYSDSEKIKALGNPTEAALLLWLHKNGINYLDIRNNAPIIDQLTFSTERKFMATLVDSPLLKKKILYVKGAPEIIFSKCKNVLVEQFVDILEYKNIVESELVKYQKQAMRTLGFAYKIIDENDVHLSINELVKAELTFLGIVSISDPIRPDVPHAVTTCLDAGINIKIITGDIAGTTKEIAQQIGIWNETDRENTILTGTEFEALSDEEILHRLPSLKILCRARPTDKQRLVKLLQQSHEIVAVTGDGTNDAPALNYAHVGLSMGSGTAVAKEASDITLLDDSFNSISTAVMWGRSLYQNIQRFLLFQLTINLTAVVIVFLGSIFDFELPLTITQMLWVNLIMDTFAAGALASLPPNHFVMQDKPRHNKNFIITPIMRNHIFLTGLSFIIVLTTLFLLFENTAFTASFFSEVPPEERNRYALSFFFTFFVMLQFWNMFNVKAFLTKKSAFSGLRRCGGFLFVIFVILIGQICIVKFGGDVFRTVPLAFKDWLIIIGTTSLVIWIGEIARSIKRKNLK